MLGFPIRTSADHGLVDGSPQLFAVTHVLHRFWAPRHPPLALCSLEEYKMLVLALQFSKGDALRAGIWHTGMIAAAEDQELEVSSTGRARR